MARTKAESAHLGNIKALPCMLCSILGTPQESETEAHHIRAGQGMAQRASDWLAVPLCFECHRGSLGLHGNRQRWRMAKADELDVLAKTIERLMA